jgi:hypothetical protein
MAKHKAEMRYGGRKPKSYLPAHNHIMHTNTTLHSERGFRRFWIPPQWVGHGWSRCPCGWRGHDPKWEVHYAGTEHVKGWRRRIKEHGSLDGAYRAVNKELAAAFRAEFPAAYAAMTRHLRHARKREMTE